MTTDFEPISPGQRLRDYIDHHGLTQIELASRLEISHQHLGDLIRDRKDVSVEMSLKFEKAGLGDAGGWLQQQITWKLWHRRQKDQRAS